MSWASEEVPETFCWRPWEVLGAHSAHALCDGGGEGTDVNIAIKCSKSYKMVIAVALRIAGRLVMRKRDSTSSDSAKNRKKRKNDSRSPGVSDA